MVAKPDLLKGREDVDNVSVKSTVAQELQCSHDWSRPPLSSGPWVCERCGKERLDIEPSTTAWKAALEALGDNPALCLMEDPSAIQVALRAAYAVDYDALQPKSPSGPWHLSRDKERWYCVRDYTEGVGPLKSQAQAFAVRDALNRMAGQHSDR